MEYRPTIGLEIHAELKTRTKMFCDSLNDPEEKKPNVNVCPICLGHPGTLPVINQKAVEHVLKVGLALGAKIPPRSKFDRKNYFYPDLPKGYQISQYDEPLCLGGKLKIGGREITIRRIHLEEDTGKLIHPERKDYSLVDFNRAGVPLMELVTEPDITSGKEARAFAEELQLLFRYLGVSDADMEKGQMRVEVNLSLWKPVPESGPQPFRKGMKSQAYVGGPVGAKAYLGTKVEIKNLNSFRSVEEAIDYEIKRQTELLENGKEITQETRGWDENKRLTFSQRWKEEAQDYRYFPEPDLPPLYIGVEPPPGGAFIDLEDLKRSLPELPWEKRKRFAEEFGLGSKEVEVLISEPDYASFFEEAVSELEAHEISHQQRHELLPLVKLLHNYLMSDLKGLANVSPEETKVTPEHLAHLVAFIHRGRISSRAAKDVLSNMFDTGRDPETIIQKESLFQVSDTGEIKAVVREIIKEEQAAVRDYKKGKAQALEFLAGKVMAKTSGRANPQIVREILTKILREK